MYPTLGELEMLLDLVDLRLGQREVFVVLLRDLSPARAPQLFLEDGEVAVGKDQPDVVGVAHALELVGWVLNSYFVTFGIREDVTIYSLVNVGEINTSRRAEPKPCFW